MRYQTNSADFDFPRREEPPSLRYVLASTPRSGSNMLVRGLWLTNAAGAPEEYLTKAFMQDFCERFGKLAPDLSGFDRWCSDAKIPSVTLCDYLNEISRIRTSPNGVFGLKLHASHLSQDHLRSTTLDQLSFPTRVVRIVRKDLVRQAISLLMAIETGEWIKDPEWHSIDQRPDPSRQEANFDRDTIAGAIEYIKALEDFWDYKLASWNIPVKVVEYETLCTEYKSQMNAIFRFLDLPERDFPSPNTRRQTDPRKELWYELFVGGAGSL